MNRRRFLALSSVAPVSSFVSFQITSAEELPKDVQRAQFIDSEDGEKLKVTIDDKEFVVRMIAADAPEEKNSDGHPECGFEESRQALISAVENKEIYLETDTEDKDKKGRLWRHVWFTDAGGGPAGLLNEQLMEYGWVIPQPEEENTKYADRYKSAAQKAEQNMAGLFNSCGGGHVAITPIPRHGSAEDPGFVGETLTASGMEVTISDAYYTYQFGYSAPKGGFMFLVFRADVHNVSDENKGYSGGRFTAKDLDRDTDFKDSYTSMSDPFESGELGPDGYTYGIVGVEVQETATNVRVKYQVNAIGGDSVYWLVPKA